MSRDPKSKVVKVTSNWENKKVMTWITWEMFTKISSPQQLMSSPQQLMSASSNSGVLWSLRGWCFLAPQTLSMKRTQTGRSRYETYQPDGLGFKKAIFTKSAKEEMTKHQLEYVNLRIPKISLGMMNWWIVFQDIFWCFWNFGALSYHQYDEIPRRSSTASLPLKNGGWLADDPASYW